MTRQLPIHSGERFFHCCERCAGSVMVSTDSIFAAGVLLPGRRNQRSFNISLRRASNNREHPSCLLSGSLPAAPGSRNSRRPSLVLLAVWSPPPRRRPLRPSTCCSGTPRVKVVRAVDVPAHDLLGRGHSQTTCVTSRFFAWFSSEISARCAAHKTSSAVSLRWGAMSMSPLGEQVIADFAQAGRL